ncbi:MAG: Na/Pi cotransporter family protein [Verrucomicrobiota bacterium]
MHNVLWFINMVGGLGVFLFGMRVMSDGLHKRSGDRMRRLLGLITGNPVYGIFTGICVTSVIQSSSATTVLLVSLVNAGLMTLEQSIGVVMGANIGTTFTAWIVSLVGFKMKITAFALPAIALALPFYFSKLERRRELAEVLIGFGILFLGLHLMKENVPNISGNPEALAFLSQVSDYGYGSVLLFIGVGTVLTVLVQSSSAAMAITLTMAYSGWIGLPVAAALVMGENIGTTITAYLASLQMNANAKRTARAHMIFNLIGIVWMLLAFYPFLSLVDWIAPGGPESPHHMPIHLAVFHSLFNITNTFLLVWFVPQIASLVRRLIPENIAEPGVAPPEITLLRGATPEAVESNLISIRHELGKMAAAVCETVGNTKNALAGDGGKLAKLKVELQATTEAVDVQREQLSRLLTDCMSVSVSESQAQRIQAQQSVINELKCIAESTHRIGALLEYCETKNLRFHKSGRDQLVDYSARVFDFLKYNTDYLTHEIDDYSFETALRMEDEIDGERDQLRKIARKKLTKGADVRAELVFLDIVRHLEHIGDYCLNASGAIRKLDNLN